MRQTWKVLVHEARARDASGAVIGAPDGKHADYLETIGVEGDGVDEAKRAAKAWLGSRGHVLRSVNVSATAARTLVAYVAPGSTAKVRAKEKKKP